MADFPIVGIGSSAGGLKALQTLFRAMPADGELGFVVVAHLDPTQESHLTELLGRCTAMPVAEVHGAVKVKPNHVYIIAPDQELTIKDGTLHAEKPSAPRGHRHPVDSFFRSLAADQRERAIAIVLSGTGTNGTLGMRFIKSEGGIALVQEPATAEFEGMPRSAIAAGIVDLILPPEKMPDALLALAKHPYVRRPLPAATAAVGAVEAAPGDASAEDAMRSLLNIVRIQTRLDFTSYKRETLMRRILRRMGLHRIERIADYVEMLRENAQEAKALAADFTINVTGFFRDPDAWRDLARLVIEPLVKARATGSTIRVWVPGCSTGEEAFTVAMLLIEHADAAKKSFDIRVFATDIAQAVLGTARAGVYPGSISADIEEDRLARFFDHEDDVYRVKKSLREGVTFAPQNLLQDPPFSRIDLISCRNLLIYLQPAVQKKLLRLFHFALREDGHLFLGSSESIAAQEDLYQTVSKTSRIYRRSGPTRHDLLDFPLVAGLGHLGGSAQKPDDYVGFRPPAGEVMDRALLDRFSPASVLIDPQFRIHYLRGPTVDYLQPASGDPSYNLLAMAREGLQMPLRKAVRSAIEDKKETSADARVRRGGTLHPVSLTVTPVRVQGPGEAMMLVTFFERGTEIPARTPPVEALSSEGELHAELEATRQDLRLTVEQMETSNEELKASNEEIRSINEELQAANEELETSKEELQSLNEELNTVNHQLQAKVEELEARTDDLAFRPTLQGRRADGGGGPRARPAGAHR